MTLVVRVSIRLIQMTENIKKLSISFKEKNKHISLADIIGFRNRIVHDYGNTDYTVVYEVIMSDIPYLKKVFFEIM